MGAFLALGDDRVILGVGDLLERIHHAVALVLVQRREQWHLFEERFIARRLLRVRLEHDRAERDAIERP